MLFSFFFFNDTATTEIYTLSLHDALPISTETGLRSARRRGLRLRSHRSPRRRDRKSTRLNSSHDQISYAVFCLKKKKKKNCRREEGKYRFYKSDKIGMLIVHYRYDVMHTL